MWRHCYESWPFAAVFRGFLLRGPNYDELCASWPHTDRVDEETLQAPIPGVDAPRRCGVWGVDGPPRAGVANLRMGTAMKFIVQWKGLPPTQELAIERFMKTGGRPPDNVELLGRWHAIGELSGVAIVEATDASGLAEWILQWGDLFSFTSAPAMSDEELGAALAAHQAASK